MDNVNDRLYQLARAQVDMVKSALGKRFTFEDDPNNEMESGYTTYGTVKTPTAIIVLRLSNHICSMKNWTERYKQKLIANNKLLRRMGRNLQDPYKDRCFYSVVFKSFDYKPNDIGKWKATCSEYVFNPLEVEENRSIGIIAQDCMKLSTNQSVINGINPTIRTATIAETKYTNMNKKLIRLTESDLHRIVKESVNRILNERVHNFKPNEFDWDEELDLMPYDGNREEYETMYNYDPKLALRGDGNEISRKQNGELKSYAKYKENRPWLDLLSSQRRLANDRIFDDQEQSVRNYGRKEAERALYDRSSEKDDVIGHAFRDAYVTNGKRGYMPYSVKQDISRKEDSRRKEDAEDRKAKRKEMRQLKDLANSNPLFGEN